MIVTLKRIDTLVSLKGQLASDLNLSNLIYQASLADSIHVTEMEIKNGLR